MAEEDSMMTRLIVALAMLTVSIACSPAPAAPDARSHQQTTPAASGGIASSTSAGSTNGVAGAMPAYYDGKLFTINFKELPSGGEDANLTHNGSINTIYMSDGCMPGGQMFVSVLDAIQGDGFNPLWQEVQVVFTKAASCKQFTSDNDILAAVAAGVVTLAPTTELYRCSVIGQKH
jgi:hypothetical protein